MMTLLLLLSSQARAVPLDLCVNKGAGPLVGLGGQYLWEAEGEPDALQPLAWWSLCGVGGVGAPHPTILQPVEGAVVNPGPLAELVVSADSGDPDGGWGRCEWWAEQEGQRFLLPVRLPGATTSRTSLPWSSTNPVCAGVASLAALQPGAYTLRVRASDLYGNYGEDVGDVRVNQVPHLLLVEPLEDTVYLTGEEVVATVVVGDDTVAAVDQVVTFVVSGAGGSTTTRCDIETAGSCTATLAAPGVAGPFEIRASYGDPDGAVGEVFSPRFYANDVPGVVVTSPVDGEMVETAVPALIEVQVTDSTAMPGDPVDVVIDDGSATWTTTVGLESNLSASVEYTPGANGEYTVTATYLDADGALGTSAPSLVVANDTPTLVVSGLTDGALLTPSESPVEVVLTVTDLDLPLGTLTGTVTGVLSSPTLALGSLDASGVASATLVLPVRDVYTATFSFTDAYGVTVSTESIQVTTDEAPEVHLVTPTSGERIQIPAGDTSYAEYAYRFEVSDADGDELEVQPAVGLDDRTECEESTDGSGAWDCVLSTSGWAAGVYTITAQVTDGLLEATDSFDIELVEAEDYDYDGDGVVVADAVYGGGWGDCDPDDPTVHGAAADGSVAAAAETCDNLDNDCSGVVNDGLPDPEGGDTLAAATGLGGTIPTLGSGDSAADQGSLYSEEDVDWWTFAVPVDDNGRDNVTFDITLSVPADASGVPSGAWSVEVVGVRPTGLAANYTTDLPAPDCSGAASTGDCSYTWTVESPWILTDELTWYLGVSSEAWTAPMCSDTEAESTYVLRVTR